MSGMTSKRLAEVRANLPDPSADLLRRERDAHALLAHTLLAHIDHLSADNARLREGIAAISSVSWDAVHPSWVKHMCRDLLNPPNRRRG